MLMPPPWLPLSVGPFVPGKRGTLTLKDRVPVCLAGVACAMESCDVRRSTYCCSSDLDIFDVSTVFVVILSSIVNEHHGPAWGSVSPCRLPCRLYTGSPVPDLHVPCLPICAYICMHRH